MGEKRDLSLSSRSEGVRDAVPVSLPVQFSLEEILQHFNESLEAIEGQYAVADELAASGNVEGCKIIWRSQIVLAEGILDFFIHEMSKYCLYHMFEGCWDKSEKYENFAIPMREVEKAVDSSRSNEWFLHI